MPFLTQITIKSTSGLVPVEVFPLGVVTLARLNPDVRRDMEKFAN